MAHWLDVADEADWERLVAAIDAAGSGLDALVNNAGIIIRKPLMQTSKSEWDKAMNVNVAGVILRMKHCRSLLAASSEEMLQECVIADVGRSGRFREHRDQCVA